MSGTKSRHGKATRANGGADEDAFSVEEAADLKVLLRRIGEQRFLDQTVRNNVVTAKKLITAFGIRPVRNFPSSDSADHLFFCL